MASVSELIKKSELAREQGDFALAIESLDQALIMSSEVDDYSGIVEVISKKILVYKSELEKTQDKVFKELMLGDIKVADSIIEAYKIEGPAKDSFEALKKEMGV